MEVRKIKRAASYVRRSIHTKRPVWLICSIVGERLSLDKKLRKHLLLLICRHKRFLLHFSKNLFAYKNFTIKGIKNGQTSRENLEKSAQNDGVFRSVPLSHPFSKVGIFSQP